MPAKIKIKPGDLITTEVLIGKVLSIEIIKSRGRQSERYLTVINLKTKALSYVLERHVTQVIKVTNDNVDLIELLYY